MAQGEYEVSVLKPGLLVRDRFGAILDARSTVTLITDQTNGQNILVDTGLASEKDELLSDLSDNNLIPSDIHILINTHAHPDHIGNNDLFPKAQFIGHRREYWGVIAQDDCKIIIKDTELAPTLRVLETPGHTKGSITILLSGNLLGTRRTNIAITGDALPILDNYLKWVPPGINYDPEIALYSMQNITNSADTIIPGHDKPFRIFDRKKRIAEYL
jgi:glyoxylase-like metal-dependent hydrolase (beta-lactamase superfamily II)